MSGQPTSFRAFRPIRRRRRLAAAPALAAVPSGVWAGAAGPAISPPAAVSAIDIVNVGGGLAIVLLSVVVIAWLYGRVQGLRGSSGQLINVVASQALGPKERVLIVDVAGQQLVLGVTAAGMRTLHVLESPIESPVVESAATELPLAADAGPGPMPSFASRLGEALKKRVS